MRLKKTIDFKNVAIMSTSQTSLSKIRTTSIVQNVHMLSKCQSVRQEDIHCARQTDRVTERQNDSVSESGLLFILREGVVIFLQKKEPKKVTLF